MFQNTLADSDIAGSGREIKNTYLTFPGIGNRPGLALG